MGWCRRNSSRRKAPAIHLRRSRKLHPETFPNAAAAAPRVADPNEAPASPWVSPAVVDADAAVANHPMNTANHPTDTRAATVGPTAGATATALEIDGEDAQQWTKTTTKVPFRRRRRTMTMLTVRFVDAVVKPPNVIVRSWSKPHTNYEFKIYLKINTVQFFIKGKNIGQEKFITAFIQG